MDMIKVHYVHEWNITRNPFVQAIHVNKDVAYIHCDEVLINHKDK
jgi:hypothetical protein